MTPHTTIFLLQSGAWLLIATNLFTCFVLRRQCKEYAAIFKTYDRLNKDLVQNCQTLLDEITKRDAVIEAQKALIEALKANQP